MFNGKALLRGCRHVSLLMLLVHSVASAQPTDGGYVNFTAWSIGEPSVDVQPALRRSKFKGNYEMVVFLDSSAKRIPELQDLWGVVWEDTLYLNIGGQRYVPMKEIGTFCYFTGPQYVSPRDLEKVERNSFLFGLIGGSATVIGVDAKNKGLIHYVLNTRTGVVHLFEPNYMRIILGDLPELQARFNAETDKAALETMLRYLREANGLLVRAY